MKLTCKVRNFTAFGDKESVIPLSTKGLTLIKGKNRSSKSKTSNGAGKSQILRAVEWGLYGTIPTGLRKADLVNTQVGKNCCVTIEIENDEKIGIIKRYIADKTNKDSLFFTVDGVDRRGSVDKDTQVNIEEFLGIDHTSFMTAVLFTMEEDSSFAGMTSSNQDKVFVNLLHLDDLVKAKEVCSRRLKLLNEQETSLSYKKTTLVSSKEVLETNLEELQSVVERWKEEQETKKTDIKSSISENMQCVAELKETLSIQELSLGASKTTYKTLEDTSKQYNLKELKNKETEIRKLQSKIDANIAVVNSEIKTKEKEINNAHTLTKDTKCTNCGSLLTEEHLYKYIEELNKKLEEKRNSLPELQSRRIEIINTLTSITTDMEAIEAISTQLVRLSSDIAVLERDIKLTYDRTMDKKYILQSLRDELNKLENEQPPQVETTDSIEKQLSEIEGKLEEVMDQLEELTYTKNLLSTIDYMFSAAGLRNEVMGYVVPELNQIAARYSNILTNGELSIQFDTKKELASGESRNKLDVKIEDMFGSNSYHSSSSGEKRRIDLCVNLALHTLAASRVGIPFVFMDEIFVKMDSRGIEYTMQLLHELLNEVPSIFIITNQDEIASEDYDNIWTVERIGKSSYLNLEDK